MRRLRGGADTTPEDAEREAWEKFRHVGRGGLPSQDDRLRLSRSPFRFDARDDHVRDTQLQTLHERRSVTFEVGPPLSNWRALGRSALQEVRLAYKM